MQSAPDIQDQRWRVASPVGLSNNVLRLLYCCFSRLNEIIVLKVRLADMRRELHVLRTGVANVDVLKREVRPSTSHQQTLCRAPNLLSKHSMYSPWASDACLQCSFALAVHSITLTMHRALSLQVASLGRQLLQERTKVKALSEELESPLNVHR